MTVWKVLLGAGSVAAMAWGAFEVLGVKISNVDTDADKFILHGKIWFVLGMVGLIAAVVWAID